jgi:cytochrome P450
MKSLAWDLLFGIFLGIDRNKDRALFAKMGKLQEDLLRGQFSLFPVSIRTPLWSSPRSRGLDAVKTLEEILAQRLQVPSQDDSGSSCPFMQKGSNDSECPAFSTDDLVAHLLVFTSSIANKAMASLLTAFLMNLFLWRNEAEEGPGASIADLIRSQEDGPTSKRMLESVLAETERLSPPVVGVMRRVSQDVVLRQTVTDPTNGDPVDYHIPQKHDAWLYLAAAGRDNQVFEAANNFMWDRYMHVDALQQQGYAFGGGVKECLGKELVRQICLTVAETILNSNVSFRGHVTEQGVRYWLGWEDNVPLEVIARDLKQLPAQRPRKPVDVEVVVQT